MPATPKKRPIIMLSTEGKSREQMKAAARSGLRKQIEEMSPQRYARAAKQAASLAKELSDRVGVEVSDDILWLATAPEEEIAQWRAKDPYEYGIEILERDGLHIVTDAGNVPMTEQEARWQFKRWPGWGYDCKRIVRRLAVGEWETVDE
jgi:hypothetical protein